MGWHRDDWSSTEVIEWEEDENSQIRPIDFDEINNLIPTPSIDILFSFLLVHYSHT